MSGISMTISAPTLNDFISELGTLYARLTGVRETIAQTGAASGFKDAPEKTTGPQSLDAAIAEYEAEGGKLPPARTSLTGETVLVEGKKPPGRPRKADVAKAPPKDRLFDEEPGDPTAPPEQAPIVETLAPYSYTDGLTDDDVANLVRSRAKLFVDRDGREKLGRFWVHVIGNKGGLKDIYEGGTVGGKPIRANCLVALSKFDTVLGFDPANGEDAADDTAELL